VILLAGDGRLEGICEDTYFGLTVEEPLWKVGVSKDVFVNDHNSELLRQRI